MKKKIVYALIIALGICTTGCGKNSAAENLQENAEIINEDTSNDVAKDINGSEETEEIVEAGENIDFEENEVGEDWKQAYIPIVKQWDIEHGNDYGYGYELVYIDNNDVPELVLACDDETGTGYDIYTCIDGEAVQLKFENDDKEQRGSNIVSPSGFPEKKDSYIEKTGIYMQGYRVRDCYVTEGCTLEENVLKDAFSYFYDDNSWDASEDFYGYTLEYINEKGEKIAKEVVTDGDEKYYDIAGVPETAQIENIYNCDFEKNKSINCTMDYKTICSMLGIDADIAELSYKEKYAKLLYEYMKDNTKHIKEGWGTYDYQDYGGKFMLKDINNDGIDEMLLTAMNEEYNVFIPADTWEESHVGNITACSDDGILEREYGETFTHYYSYYRLEDGELKCFDSFCSYDNPDYGDDIITEYTHVDSAGNKSIITEAEFNAGDGLYGVHDVEGGVV